MTHRVVATVASAVAVVTAVVSTAALLSPSRPTSSSRVWKPSPPPPQRHVWLDGGPGHGKDPIDTILRRLPSGHAVVNAPSHLQMGESADVELLVSEQEPLAQLRHELSALGPKHGAKIKVSSRMEAHLSGLAFGITPGTPETQLVRRSGRTQWAWEIEPEETGTHRLHLTLSALIHFNGSDTALVIQTFKTDITTRVTWVSRVSGFASDNWKWLWSAILVPVVPWLLRRRARKNDEPGPTSATEAATPAQTRPAADDSQNKEREGQPGLRHRSEGGSHQGEAKEAF